MPEEAAPDSQDPESVLDEEQEAEPDSVELEPEPVLDDAGEPEPGPTEPEPQAALLPEVAEPEAEAVLVAGPEAVLDEGQEAEPDTVELEPEPVLDEAGETAAEPEPELSSRRGRPSRTRSSRSSSPFS